MIHPDGNRKEVKDKYILFRKTTPEIHTGPVSHNSSLPNLNLDVDDFLSPIVSTQEFNVGVVQSQASNSAEVTDQSNTNELNDAGNENVDIEISPEDFEKVQKLVQQIESGNFRCILCNFLSNEANRVSGHIIIDHPMWKESLPSQNVDNSRATTRNIFDHQDWKTPLRENFYERVVKKCSQLSRSSWKDKRKFKADEQHLFIRVRADIIEKLVDEVVDIFGSSPTPTESDLRDVIRENLVNGYEFMFSEKGDAVGRSDSLSSGYGLGGNLGPKCLPKQLKSRILNAQLRLRKKELSEAAENGEEVPENAPKKGKNKTKRYGEFFPLNRRNICKTSFILNQVFSTGSMMQRGKRVRWRHTIELEI